MSIDRLKSVVEQINARIPATRGRGEEATKQALILPLLSALGYDIWNPAEVCPEYEADFAIRKGGQKEKVDLAILSDGSPLIFVEVKTIDEALDGHEGQLARYFNADRNVCLAILSNGIDYRFFTDTGDPNVMDKSPFHGMRLDAADPGLDILARFHKSVFSPEAIREFATELIYLSRMVKLLRKELDLRDKDPSEELVRWILGAEKMYEGRVTANVVERFAPISKNALTIVLRDIVRRSLAALDKGVSEPEEGADDSEVETTPESELVPGAEQEGHVKQADTEEGKESESGTRIVTTDDELECFAIIKSQFDTSDLSQLKMYDSASRQDVPVELAYKDTTGYFGIYLNRPSCWAMRIAMGGRKPWVGFNIDPEAAQELVPTDLRVLKPNAWAPFRVAIPGPDSLHTLSRLNLAAMRKVIDNRKGSPPET